MTRCTITPNYLSGEELRNWRSMQAIKGNSVTERDRAWPSWLLRVPPGQRKADEGWPVGERNRCSVCRSWHYVQHDAMGSLYVGQKSWETEGSLTGSALSGWKFYLCNAGNAHSYAIPEGLVTRDPPPISCSLCYPAKTERRHNIGGLPYPWRHCSSWVPCSAYRESIFEDAEAFKPERWLRNKDITLIESAEAFASLPFGFGTRMCLGRRIAELELHLLMARIVQQFDISYQTEVENVDPFMRGVTIPGRPVRVQFVDRQWVRLFSSRQVYLVF